MSAASFGLIVAIGVLLAGATLALLALLALRLRQDQQLERRLLGAAADAEFGGAEAAALRGLRNTGKRIEAWVDKDGETPRLLVQAGWRGAEGRAAFYAFQAGVLLAAVVATLLMWSFGAGHIRAAMLPLYTFAVFALAILAPRWALRSAAARRRARIAREVPLFIHLLVLLFEAGLSTRQAFASLVREGRGVLPELGREFETALRQMEAGGDTAAVLRGMGETLSVPDLDGVLGVLRQADRYGGEIREPLLETLAVLEERRGLDLREKVNLVSGRMTVVMVLFFFPALLIFVAGPAVVSILSAMADVAGTR